MPLWKAIFPLLNIFRSSISSISVLPYVFKSAPYLSSYLIILVALIKYILKAWKSESYGGVLLYR